MKTAIYIEDGLTQFVLTPETDIDKKILVAMQSTDLKTYRGSFYNCRGGWVRHEEPRWADQYMGYPRQNNDDDSLIFVINKETGAVAKQDAPQISVQQVTEALQDGCRFHSSPEPAVYPPCIHRPLGGPCEICLAQKGHS